MGCKLSTQARADADFPKIIMQFQNVLSASCTMANFALLNKEREATGKGSNRNYLPTPVLSSQILARGTLSRRALLLAR